MLCFAFTGRDSQGNRVQGRVLEASAHSARERLGQRLAVDSLRLDWGATLRELVGGRSGMTYPERALFLRQLAVLFAAGIHVERALEVLEAAPGSLRVGDAVRRLRAALQGGSSLSQAVEGCQEHLPPPCSAMLRVGESTGSMVEVLRLMADLSERVATMRLRVSSALTYPAFLLVGCVLGVSGVASFFLPRIAGLFETFPGPVPPLVSGLLAVSRLLGNPLFLLGLVEAVGAALVALWLWFSTEPGRDWLDRTLLGLPAAGPLVRASCLSRLACSLAIMTRCGLPLGQALGLLSSVAENGVYSAALEEACLRVRDGATLSEALSEHPRLFPRPFVGLYRVGEETGRPERTLESLNRLYDQEVEHRLEVASALIEPLLLLFMGVLVGGTALLMLLPLVTALRAAL